MKIRRRILHNIYVLLLVAAVFLAAGVGYLISQKTAANQPMSEVDTPKYVSLSGGYLFSIPAKYSVDETGLSGVTLIYPEGQLISGESLEKLYDTGTIAIQPIAELKDDNIEAFKNYISNTFAEELRTALKSATDIREVKQSDPEAIKVFAQTNEGKRLRTVYALNLSRPVLMVTKEESNALKIIGGSMEDLKKTNLKADIDQVVKTTNLIIESLKKQDAASARKKSTASFKKTEPEKQLAAKLKESARYLSRPMTIVGGSYNGKVFIAQFVFEPKEKEQTTVGGLVSLSRENNRYAYILGRNNSWKLDGLQLPK